MTRGGRRVGRGIRVGVGVGVGSGTGMNVGVDVGVGVGVGKKGVGLTIGAAVGVGNIWGGSSSSDHVATNTTTRTATHTTAQRSTGDPEVWRRRALEVEFDPMHPVYDATQSLRMATAEIQENIT